MGQILHGSATTTHRIRKKIQESEKTLKRLSEELNVNVKTVKKWKNRDFTEDLRCGRKKGDGSVLDAVSERIIVETRLKLCFLLMIYFLH